MSQGINRISIVVPSGSSAQLALVRDEKISKLSLSLGEPPGDLWHYVDNSPLGMWAYQYETFVFSNGILTVGTVSCSGMAHPPSGSNLLAVADPGAGSNTWTVVGALPIIRTSGDQGSVSPPAGNNNYYVWPVSGNSPTVVADFTAAVGAIAAALAGPINGNFVAVRYFKYVDSVSGAWQFSAAFFGPGATVSGNTGSVTVSPTSNILYAVTCAGTPNPPAGSSSPAVACPSFAQTPIVTIGSPLNFGPQR